MKRDINIADRYVAQKELGSGGMAVVYKANDIVLKRTVALKVLHSHFAEDEHFIARFRREAQSAAKLTHPNIVSVYDVGQEGDTHYIVMEYVSGMTLKQYIKKKAPISTAKIIEITKQIAEALEVAHANGIIHRDIKPHNVIISKSGEIKVTDFGIARCASSSTVTRTGAIIGTAHYMSPEQARGEVVGLVADIYSLGVVMYEMATGEPPFNGENPVAVALKHINETPLSPRAVRSRVPEGLDAIIMKAMAKEPEDRFKTAHDLKNELEKLGRSISSKQLHTLAGNGSIAKDSSSTQIEQKQADQHSDMYYLIIPMLQLMIRKGTSHIHEELAIQELGEDLIGDGLDAKILGSTLCDSLLPSRKGRYLSFDFESSVLLKELMELSNCLSNIVADKAYNTHIAAVLLEHQLITQASSTTSRSGLSISTWSPVVKYLTSPVAKISWSIQAKKGHLSDKHLRQALAFENAPSVDKLKQEKVLLARVYKGQRRWEINLKNHQVRACLGDFKTYRRLAYQHIVLGAGAIALIVFLMVSIHQSFSFFKGIDALLRTTVMTLIVMPAIAILVFFARNGLAVGLETLRTESKEQLLGFFNPLKESSTPKSVGHSLGLIVWSSLDLIGLVARNVLRYSVYQIGALVLWIRKAPDRAKEHYENGVAEFNAGNFSEASNNLKKAAIFIKEPDIYRKLAWSEHNRRNDHKAIKYSIKALSYIEADDKLHLLHVNNEAAIIYKALGRLDEARKCYLEALKVSHGNPIVEKNLRSVEQAIVDRDLENLFANEEALASDAINDSAGNFMTVGAAKNRSAKSVNQANRNAETIAREPSTTLRKAEKAKGTKSRKSVLRNLEDVKFDLEFGVAWFAWRKLVRQLKHLGIHAARLAWSTARTGPFIIAMCVGIYLGASPASARTVSKVWGQVSDTSSILYHSSAARIDELDNNLDSAVNHQEEVARKVYDTKSLNALKNLKVKAAQQHSNLGEQQIQQKHYSSAVAEFSKAVAFQPKNSKYQNLLGQSLYNLKKYEEAATAYQKALNLTPDDATLNYGMAMAQIEINQVGNAITHLKKACELEPTEALYHRKLARVLEYDNKWDDALSEFSRLLELMPKDKEALEGIDSAKNVIADRHNRKGLELSNNGDHNGALNEYLDAIRFKPDYAVYHYNAAISYDWLNRYQDAMNEYSTAVSLYSTAFAQQPNDASIKKYYARASLYLGYAKYNQGDRQGGLNLVRQAAALDSEHQNSYCFNCHSKS